MNLIWPLGFVRVDSVYCFFDKIFSNMDRLYSLGEGSIFKIGQIVKVLFFKNTGKVVIWVLTVSFEVDESKMITCPCNEYPLTPHFYIVKLGFTGVYIFSYFCLKI